MVIDPHPVPRQGLVQLIGLTEDLAVLSMAEQPEEAMQMVSDLKPDVVVCDLSAKGGGSTELIKQLHAAWTPLPILVFSHQDESVFAGRALRSGARGYVMKSEPADTVLDAIRTVLRGEIYLSGQMARRMLNHMVNGDPVARQSGVESLSNRQLEVFELIGYCLGSREIAERLNVSVKTVNAHRAQIRKKLDLGSASQLVQRAVEWVQGQ